MTTFVADHSTGGAIIGGSLKKHGFVGVLRYAATGRGDVNISRAEFEDLKANGLEVGIVLEHEADWLLHGNIQSRVAGSRDVCRAAGLPDGVIYLAADFDVTLGGPVAGPGAQSEQNMRAVLEALNEAGAVIGRGNVGFYGSKFAIDWLIKNAPGIKYFWQTEAWSQGQLSQRAQLYQRAQAVSVAGVQCDIDVQLQKDWGQRVAQKPVPLVHHRRRLSNSQKTYNRGFQDGFEAGWHARGQ